MQKTQKIIEVGVSDGEFERIKRGANLMQVSVETFMIRAALELENAAVFWAGDDAISA